MTHFVELDIVDTADLPQTAAKYNLTYKVLAEDGPAGGNPLVEFAGTKADLESFITNDYSKDDAEDAEMFISNITTG